MFSAPNVREYIEQLVKVAGKGNITVDFALHVDRMQLHCKSCDVTMTNHVPERSDKIDYSIQNFITLHGHNGGHNDKKKFEEDYGKATAVTLDFKKVPLNGGFGYVPLPPNAKAILKAGDMIDLKSSVAQQIEGQMSAYDKEMAEKMSPENLAKKIAFLQQTDYSGELAKGVAELKAKGLMTPEQVGIEQKKIEQSKAELQGLQNILTLKNMEKKKAQLLGEISGQHSAPTPPPVKKDKPLKIATGRKFR